MPNAGGAVFEVVFDNEVWLVCGPPNGLFIAAGCAELPKIGVAFAVDVAVFGAVKLNADDFCPNVGAFCPNVGALLVVVGCDAGTPNGFGGAAAAGCIAGIPNGPGAAVDADCGAGMPNGFDVAAAVGVIDMLGFKSLAPPNENAPVAGLLATAPRRFADGELVVDGSTENALVDEAADVAWLPPNCIGEFVADAKK